MRLNRLQEDIFQCRSFVLIRSKQLNLQIGRIVLLTDYLVSFGGNWSLQKCNSLNEIDCCSIYAYEENGEMVGQGGRHTTSQTIQKPSRI